MMKQMTWREIVTHPLPYQSHSVFNRGLARAISGIARNQLKFINGLEYIAPEYDPFILALNHTTHREAILLPVALAFNRGGKLVHFLADWNYRLIPGVNLLYSRGEVITVTHKPARPRILDVFRPLFKQSLSPLDQAKLRLMSGNSIGIFPEGTVNRDPKHLLRGQYGAARLSLATKIPVIPVGIRHYSQERFLEISIGKPQFPPFHSVGLSCIRAWHAHIMAEIARLSGKRWSHGKISYASQ